MNAARLYVFDAYGTLLDVHSAVSKHAAAIGGDATRFSELWRAKQLEYTWTLSLMGRYEPFWNLTERALDFAFAKFLHVDHALRASLLDAYRSLDAYAEVPPVLRELRERGAKLAVLSNGNREMLDAAFTSAGLIGLLDRLLSVEDVRVFKTHPNAYRMLQDAFAVATQDIVFVSSNRWDVAGATSFGLASVWVNRSGQPNEYETLAPRRMIADLNALLAT
jgi:2-haloacid dehalogenase